MGFFSKTCAKTHLPVLASMPWARVAPRLTNIVVLRPNREPRHAEYDGYGLGLDDYDEAKFVLASDYAGETYEQLGPSEDDPQQGYFFGEHLVRELSQLPKFATFEDYWEVMREYEEGIDTAYEQGLAALGLSFEAGKAFRVANLLLDLHDGSDQRHPVDLSQFPSLQEHTLEALREKSHVFATAHDARMAELARRVVHETAATQLSSAT